MPKIAFTDLAVRSLKEGTYFDTKTTDFGLRVGKNRRTWFAVRSPSRSRVKLGLYPTLSLSEARRKAHGIIGSAETAKVDRASMTFGAALPDFLEDHYKDARGKRTKSEAKRLLTNHFQPLHTKQLGSIEDDDLAPIFARLKDRPSEQLHAYRAARVFFKWCTRPPRRYIGHNPLEGYEAPSKDKKGSRILADTELIKVWKAAGGMGQFGTMIRLIILWGTRNGELARTKRVWIEEDVVVIDGSVTKNGRPHAIPLLPLAKSLLAELEEDGPYLFPGHIKGEHFNDGSWGKLKGELNLLSGVKGWQVRDLRRTFRSTMPRLKVPRHIAEILVNHVTGGDRNILDEIYDRYEYLPEKKAALKKYEAHIKQLLAP